MARTCMQIYGFILGLPERDPTTGRNPEEGEVDGFNMPWDSCRLGSSIKPHLLDSPIGVRRGFLFMGVVLGCSFCYLRQTTTTKQKKAEARSVGCSI